MMSLGTEFTPAISPATTPVTIARAVVGGSNSLHSTLTPVCPLPSASPLPSSVEELGGRIGGIEVGHMPGYPDEQADVVEAP